LGLLNRLFPGIVWNNREYWKKLGGMIGRGLECRQREAWVVWQLRILKQSLDKKDRIILL